MQAFKHIFTSPSSVDIQVKATKSGNARIHGMTSVTRASIVYAATQVKLHLNIFPSFDQWLHSQARFALCATGAFSRTDTTTESECFYNSLLELLEDPDEIDEVNALLTWWNW